MERVVQQVLQRLNDCLGRRAVQSQRPRQGGMYHTDLSAARAPHQRIGGPKQRQRAGADGGSEMGNTGVMARENFAPSQYRCQLRQRRFSQHFPGGTEDVQQLGNATRLLGRSANQNTGRVFFCGSRHHLLPAFQGPQLMLSAAAGMHSQHTAFRQARRSPRRVGQVSVAPHPLGNANAKPPLPGWNDCLVVAQAPGKATTSKDHLQNPIRKELQ